MNGADQPGNTRRIAALDVPPTAARRSPPIATVAPLATNPVTTARKTGVEDIKRTGTSRSNTDHNARKETAGNPGHQSSIRGKIIAVTAAPE